LGRIGPCTIYGFPSVLQRLAWEIGEGAQAPAVRILVSHGETLGECARQQIEAAFRAPLYHTYGSTEIPRMAFECRRRRGYHVLATVAVVETLEESQPAEDGREGSIVVTHLLERSMPLLRYRIGDRGVLSSRRCACGLSFPMLEEVTGRDDDFVILPSGKRVPARVVNDMEIPGIREYKLVQRRPDHFEMLVVASSDFTSATLSRIESAVRSGCLGEDISVAVRCVESLPLLETGKLQSVIRDFAAGAELGN